jgi:hypothetical protein
VTDGYAVTQARRITAAFYVGRFVSFVTEPAWPASCITSIVPDSGGLGRKEARIAAAVLEKQLRAEGLPGTVNG